MPEDDQPYPEPLAKWLREVSAGIERARPHVGRRLNQLFRVVADVHDALGNALEPALTWVREHETEIAAALYAASQASRPPNWRKLSAPQMTKIMRLTLRPDGTPVAWLPPSDVLGPMLDMDSLEQRDPIMLKHQATIVASARELLGEIVNPDLQELREAVIEAWDAWDAGHKRAAQALAASALTAVVQAPYGLNLKKLSHLRDELDKARRNDDGKLDAATLGWSMREISALNAIATALRVNWDALGQPGFNRHLTVHGVSADIYTEANALRGLITVTAAVREIQWLRDHPLVPALVQK